MKWYPSLAHLHGLYHDTLKVASLSQKSISLCNGLHTSVGGKAAYTVKAHIGALLLPDDKCFGKARMDIKISISSSTQES